MANVTPEELKAFHSMDRRLYAVLVRDLARDATKSLHVMGLWLWLERRGSFNLVHKILQLPLNAIETMFREAMECLMCMEHGCFPVGGNIEIPFTRQITEVAEASSLQFFLDNKDIALNGVQSLVSEVCRPAFSDIQETAPQGGVQHNPTPNQVARRPVHGAQGMSTDPLQASFLRMRIRGDPRHGPSRGDSRCDRTMFVTFSKGYPVSDVEVWSYIVRTQGMDCVESIYMEDVPPGEQAIYAKVVFTRASFVESVLGGHVKVRITINGKHVNMRKFT